MRAAEKSVPTALACVNNSGVVRKRRGAARRLSTLAAKAEERLACMRMTRER